jgi:hypothetical protein
MVSPKFCCCRTQLVPCVKMDGLSRCLRVRVCDNARHSGRRRLRTALFAH